MLFNEKNVKFWDSAVENGVWYDAKDVWGVYVCTNHL